MDRSCPKRKKTKKIQSDGDVNKYFNSQDGDPVEKLINMSKIPEEWETGLVLSLYHTGYTVAIPPNTKLPSAIISYDESHFIRSIEEGLIPDQLVPLLGELNMLADSKLVVTVTDYRGFPRPGSTVPYLLDFPITTRHVLHRSTQSMVLELYDTLGEQLSLDQLQQLENYLLMLHCPPLCLDTSPQVFSVKSDIHTSQHFLNHPPLRHLITQLNRASGSGSPPPLSVMSRDTPSADVSCDLIEDIGVVLRHGNRDNAKFLKSKDASIDGRLGKLKISSDVQAPSYLSEILDLCTKRARALSAQNIPPSPEQPSPQPEASPGPPSGAPFSSPALPHLKPAPFVSSTKPGGGTGVMVTAPGSGGNVMVTAPGVMGTTPGGVIAGVGASGVMPPISPVPLPPTVLPNTSPMTPGAANSPHMVVPPLANNPSPKNVATVNRMPVENRMSVEPSKTGTNAQYNTGYVVPQQQINSGPRQPQQVQRVAVPMMQMSQQPGIIAQQPAGIIRAPGGQILHVPQQIRPANGTAHIDPTMNKPLPNAGMMMSQQYPRGYQYTNVQPMARGYVEAAQYIPVQQPRAGPVQLPRPGPVQLQISLPPNMNPHQTRQRQPAPSIAPQNAMHNITYNQMPVGQIQNSNLQNTNLTNQNMFNQFR